MADGGGGGGGGGGGDHASASSSSSPPSLDGGHLLRLLLQNPKPQPSPPETALLSPSAYGTHHHFFDPAVAAVGPVSSSSPLIPGHHHHHLLPNQPLLFSSPSPLPPGPHFAGIHWSPSPQQQQQSFPNYFPDHRHAAIRQFPPPLGDLAANFGFPGANFIGTDGIVANRSEKPKPKPSPPPPGFAKSPPAAARHVFGKIPHPQQQQKQQQKPHVAYARDGFSKTPQRGEQQSHARDWRGGGVAAAMPGGSSRSKGPGQYATGAKERQENGRKQPGAGDSYDRRLRVEGDSEKWRVDGKMVVEVRNLEASYQKSVVGFATHSKEDCEEVDTISEQLVESVVIGGDGEVKNGVVVRKGGSRGKDFRADFFRGHNVSSQRIRIQRRTMQCRRDIDLLTPNFLSIFESLVPSAEEIAKQKQLLMSLSKLINKEWPDAKLYLYGSCANSFGVSNSDIDVCLSIDESEKSKADILLKLADILQSGNLRNVQALTRARVPIVKLMDPDTGLSCDICINNLLAVVNTKLLRDYSKIDKRLRQLAFIVKHWAKSRRVNETYQGTLSSYAYVIMCIHLLQQRKPAILPCLQAMDATYVVTVDNTEYGYFDQVEKLYNFSTGNNESIARLLWAFFHYWAYQHDYTTDVISIRTGSIIRKHMKDWTRRVGNDRHLVCIEDPFEISHDLGRVVDKFSIKILREEFERAANILQYDPNPSVTLFEPYVASPSQNIKDDVENKTEAEAEAEAEAEL